MNKKIIFTLRSALYLIAAYFLYDHFIADKNTNEQRQSIELEIFNESATTQYYEFFLKQNETDSLWYELQLQPSLGTARKLGKNSPWDRKSNIWLQYRERGYIFKAFYLTKDIKLTAKSFFQIADRIESIQTHSDKRLSSIHKNKDITIILTKK